MSGQDHYSCREEELCRARALELPNAGFTSQRIEDRLVKFDMRLQDVPGLAAEPYPNSDWRVVRATSPNSALGSEEIILSGCSDDDGNIALQGKEEKLLQEECNKTPKGIPK